MPIDFVRLEKYNFDYNVIHENMMAYEGFCRNDRMEYIVS